MSVCVCVRGGGHSSGVAGGTPFKPPSWRFQAPPAAGIPQQRRDPRAEMGRIKEKLKRKRHLSFVHQISVSKERAFSPLVDWRHPLVFQVRPSKVATNHITRKWLRENWPLSPGERAATTEKGQKGGGKGGGGSARSSDVAPTLK